MPPSSTAHTRTPQELLGTITLSLAHLAATSLPAALAVSNAIPMSQLFPSSDLLPSSTPQLPYPLVASSTVSAALAWLGQTTALQSNPVALVAQMVSTQSQPQPLVPSFFPALCIVATQTETSLIQAGLNPPPPFPLYLGLSTPEVQTHGNSTSAWRILQEDISPMDRQFECIGLVINMIVHDGLLSFSDIHRAIAQHQALPKSPKIPGFNSDPDVSYLTSGWCLQQMRCTLTAYTSMVKAPVDTGSRSDPTLKHIFIIAPTYAKACLPHPCFAARAIFSLAFLPCMLENSYQAEEEQCLRLCRGEDPNLYPLWGGSQVRSITCPPHPMVVPTVAPSSSSLSTSTLMVSSAHGTMQSTQEENHDEDMVVDNDDDKENQSPGMAQPSHPPFVPMHVPRPPPPFSAPRWDHPGQDLLGIVKQRVSPSHKLRIHAKDLPPGEVIDPSHHGEPVLLPQTLVMNWWWPEAFLDGTIVHRLPNDSLLVSLRFPIPDLTSDQAGFWWAVGFLLALFSTATGQACLPVQGALIHVLLPHALGQCRYQIDHWTPSFIYSTDPAMGELMLPWLDLGKTQAVTADPDGKDRLKEPVPQFLMAYCSDILSWDSDCIMLLSMRTTIELSAPISCSAMLSLTCLQPTMPFMQDSTNCSVLSLGHQHEARHWYPSMIKDACERKNKMALEFIYWWFDNRLERVEQLIPHLEYDIGPIVNTPQNNLSFTHGEAETLAHRMSRAFQNALEEYLRVDIKERGKQLLLAMMASPYLPTNPDKKLKFQFRLLNNDVWMDVPTTKSLWSFVHGCFQTIDIGYDGVLASLLANGSWRGITVDSYFQGIFMGDVTCFNVE
ncbi:hypothetical protein EDD18DRAFT_1358441 [Armillaria luteobubalina]|uniref:Uncharacterized protein n=1 Tax=Armillaria luteobubalina TaxID=153913 RepID=A0AA39PYM3_9AGAR|nr:hypothetical protein EDD18DRAFT_1358441 [Armillaria luteobubalina]